MPLLSPLPLLSLLLETPAPSPLWHNPLVLVLTGAVLTQLFAWIWRRNDRTYSETKEGRNKQETEAAAAAVVLTARNNERTTQRTDHDRLRAEHDAVRVAVKQLEDKLHQIDVASASNQTINASTKETLARIDGQLGRLIDTFMTRS